MSPAWPAVRTTPAKKQKHKNLDRINRIYMMIAQYAVAVYEMSCTSAACPVICTPPHPAAAPHRQPLTEALERCGRKLKAFSDRILGMAAQNTERRPLSALTAWALRALACEGFERAFSNLGTLYGKGFYCPEVIRSRSPRIGAHKAWALGGSGEQEMGRASKLARTIWRDPRHLERRSGIQSIR